LSDNPTDLLSQRHKGYRQAQERYQRATAAREAAHRLWPSSSRGWRPPRPATGSTLAMRSSMDSAHPSPSDSVRVRLEEAKREREALVYAEERAAPALSIGCPESTRPSGFAQPHVRSTKRGPPTWTQSMN
jgi:hypothetical protein